MNLDYLPILIAVLASPFIGVFVQRLFDRRKTGAETQNLNISGEINIGDAWKNYAKKIQEDFEGLKRDFEKLSEELREIKREKDELAIITKAKDEEIRQLTQRVSFLEKELQTYRSKDVTITKAAEIIHNKIDEATDEIIKGT